MTSATRASATMFRLPMLTTHSRLRRDTVSNWRQLTCLAVRISTKQQSSQSQLEDFGGTKLSLDLSIARWQQAVPAKQWQRDDLELEALGAALPQAILDS